MKIDAKKMRILWQITAVIYLICVLFLCFGRFDNAQDDLPNFILGIPMDKVGHFLMFVPFTIIAVYGFHRSTGKAGRFILFMFLAYLLGTAMAAGIEIGQSYTDYRSCDAFDFMADTLGLCFGAAIVVAVQSATQKW